MDGFEAQVGRLGAFPAKPVINELTRFAESRREVEPEAVVAIVCQAIERAPDAHALPLLYLADSIMKNAGGPYASLFSRQLDTQFPRVLARVSAKDATLMRRLLGTWRTQRVFDPTFLAPLEALFTDAGGAPPQPHAAKRSRLDGAGAATAAAAPAERVRAMLARLQSEQGVPASEQLTVEEVAQHNPALLRQIEAMVASQLAAAVDPPSSSAWADVPLPPAPPPTGTVCLSTRTLRRRQERVLDPLFRQLPYISGPFRFASRRQCDAFVAEQSRRQRERRRQRGWFQVPDEWVRGGLESADRPAGASVPVAPGQALPRSSGAAHLAQPAPAQAAAPSRWTAPAEAAMCPADEDCPNCVVCGDALNMEICDVRGSELEGQWVYKGVVRNPSGPAAGLGSLVHVECIEDA